MTDEIIARAKIIAGIDGEDELLSLYCEDAINYVLSYCRLSVMPQKLCGITAQLAVAAYLRGAEGGVASVKEGDREITYAVTSAAEGFRDNLAPFVNRSGRVPSEVVRDV